MVQPTKYSGTYTRASTWAGYRFKDALGYTAGRHTGVDYNGAGAGDADLGLPVKAIARGKIVYVGDRSDLGFGKTVIIEHPFGVQTGATKSYSRYMHLQTLSGLKKGQAVKHGQVFSKLGKSGTKYAHLHLDLWSNKNGLGAHLEYHKNTQLTSYVDPFLYIASNPNKGKDSVPTYPRWVRVKSLKGANVRRLPKTSAPLAGSRFLPYMTVFRVAGKVTGESINGNNKWYKSVHGNYVWTGNVT